MIALEELHRRLPDYRLVAGTTPEQQLTFVRTTRRLELEFTPEPQEGWTGPTGDLQGSWMIEPGRTRAGTC